MAIARLKDSPATIGSATMAAATRLAQAGVAEPRRDARLLVAHALSVGMEIVLGFPERRLTDEEALRLETIVVLRAQRRPMAQILGRREFWSLSFEVTADTLDPRPDSECLVETVLAHVPDRDAPLRILDLGTGTGCLLLAILSELPRATGLGVDIKPAACAVAARNAAALGLEARANFAVGNWAQNLTPGFDLIVTNPPYIPDAELDGLEPEVARFEPRTALCGGADGLDAYRALAPEIARLLASRGRAVIEIGAGQAGPVEGILSTAGLVCLGKGFDLAKRERCLVVRQDAR